jgi:hypothetical protein
MENFVGRRRKRNDDDVEEVEAENIQNHKAMKIREAGTIKTLGGGAEARENIFMSMSCSLGTSPLSQVAKRTCC